MTPIRNAVLVLVLTAFIPLGATGAAEAPSVSKTGLPYRPDSDEAGPPEIVKAIRERRPGGKLLNLDRMLLNSPAFAQGWNSVFGTIRNKLTVPPILREIAIMSIGVLNKADYEWFQHEGEFLKAGGTRDQLAALALTYEMTRNIEVKPATMKRIRAVLSDQQVVELIGTIAGYNMVSRFVVATGLEPEGSG